MMLVLLVRRRREEIHHETPQIVPAHVDVFFRKYRLIRDARKLDSLVVLGREELQQKIDF